MKYLINSKWLAVLFTVVLNTCVFAQGIRKHYTELTNDERMSYKVAIEILDNLGVREEYAGYHADPDNDGSNGNQTQQFLPERPDDDSPIHGVQEFLPWHRQFILEFERELQNQNEYLTIPYWDWTGASDPAGVDSDNDSGPLWDNGQIGSLEWSSNFLGEYDNLWNLNRDLSAPPSLPTVSQVDAILLSSTFSNFRNIEGQIHGNPHVWVDGEMSDILYSPRDPIFYFHHAMVDKIWQDWEVKDNTNSSFTDNTMPTFDGSVPGFDFVNQNSIVDSRDLGVFYSDAMNQIATLEMYSVNNQPLPSEKFTYQYKIEAKNDFLVQSGRNAEFRSCEVIELLPGFCANNGSVFKAEIDDDCNLSTGRLFANNTDSKKYNYFSDNRHKNLGDIDKINLNNSPNPFADETKIEFTLKEELPVTIIIYDLTGRQIDILVDNKLSKIGLNQTSFNGTDYPRGAYYYTLQAGDYFVSKNMTIIK